MQGNKQYRKRLGSILDRAMTGLLPDSGEIRFLLSLSDKEDLDSVFTAARLVRRRFFGDRVFFYGFLYFSTFCRNNCSFCHYRRSNTALKRYRKTPEEVMEAAEAMAASGVHLIDLTAGESTELFHDGGKGISSLVKLVGDIKQDFSLPVMVSPGVVPEGVLQELVAAGADWYACYQETHNRRLFARLRTGQDYDERMGAKMSARRLGMLIEEGILIGVGEAMGDVADSFASMCEIGADQVRVMTFVPQEGTPMAGYDVPDSAREMLIIAVLRLVFQDRLIPASLDVGGLGGLQKRLEAGANVVTSLVVPGRGLAGVANKALDIEHARRTPQAVRPILDGCGLETATRNEYSEWVRKKRFQPAAYSSAV